MKYNGAKYMQIQYMRVQKVLHIVSLATLEYGSSVFFFKFKRNYKNNYLYLFHIYYLLMFIKYIIQIGSFLLVLFVHIGIQRNKHILLQSLMALRFTQSKKRLFFCSKWKCIQIFIVIIQRYDVMSLNCLDLGILKITSTNLKFEIFRI